MSGVQGTSYDEIPYHSRPRYTTHPDCLATLAILHGMNPAPLNRCRVLELGCATGGNLVPVAATLPSSEFVGIDLSTRQIATAQKLANSLGLKNIDFRVMNIAEVDEGLDKFDYIICHGVFSWVAAAVQEHILRICRQNLAPHGVAYISYNTYPGWHARQIARDLFKFRARRFDDPHEWAPQSRVILDSLLQWLPKPDSAYARVLREEADLIASTEDPYIFHEHLEEENQPFYFYQFVERITAHGLQYLSESLDHNQLGNLPPEVRRQLQQLCTSDLELEEYLDFLNNRTFRRSLVCHQAVTLDRRPTADAMTRLHVIALGLPVSKQPELATNAPEEFRSNVGGVVTANSPLLKTALCLLAEALPQALRFDALWTAVQDRLDSLLGEEARTNLGVQELADGMWGCFQANLVSLFCLPPVHQLQIRERPTASPLARLQAETSAQVTDLRHSSVDLGELDRTVLRLLDGTRDRAALREELAKTVTSTLDELLEQTLQRLAHNALLID